MPRILSHSSPGSSLLHFVLESALSNESTTYLQIAAEAFYDLKKSSPETRLVVPIEERMLISGNDRTSKFTKSDAAWFVQNWEVVEHINNTATGFSGTLFRAKASGWHHSGGARHVLSLYRIRGRRRA